MRRAVEAMAGVALGLFLVVVLHKAFAAANGPQELLQLRYQVDRYLTTGETLLQTLLILLGIPAALLLARGFVAGVALAPATSARVVAALGRVPARVLFLLLALLAMTLTATGAICLTDLSWFTDDELAYLHQAQIYAGGQLTESALSPRDAFPHPLVIDVPAGADGLRAGHWTGVYPVFPPMLLALGLALGSAHISQVLVVGLVVYHSARLAEALFDSRAAGLVAGALTATSPALLGLGTGFHNVLPAMFFTVLTARMLLAATGAESARQPMDGERPREHNPRERALLAAAAGLSAGLTFLCRPLEGTLVVLAAGLVFLGRTLYIPGPNKPPRGPRVAALLAFGAAGLVALSFYLVTNLRVMGDALTTPYQALEDARGKFFGFGPGRLWGVTHTFEAGVSQVITSLARLNVWLLAWPIAVAALYPYLTGTVRDRRVLYMLGVAVVHVVVYLYFSFGSVHDFGTAYGSWHTPLLAIVSAGAFAHYAAHVAPDSKRFLIALGIAASVVGWSSFGVLQARRVRAVAAIIQAPLHAAEAAIPEGPAIVLWSHYQPPGGGARTWVYHPPIPHAGDRIWWFHERTRVSAQQIAAAYPDRPLYRFVWRDEQANVEAVALSGVPR